ncbi:MAG TPA: hypothetical protein VHN82_03370 [Methanoregula sp.]|nr:hypothetical protein [Methanoregula sp.]
MADKTLGDAEKVIGGGVSTLGKGAEGFSKEFMDFLQKYQVIGLAVAFVIRPRVGEERPMAFFD